MIIGAGICGLAAAKSLTTAVVLDKGRSVGGRMATRRVADGVPADTGAQFMTVRSKEFAALLRGLPPAHIWQSGSFWEGGSNLDTHERGTNLDTHERWASRGGMNALVKALAKSLPDTVQVRINVLVDSLRYVDGEWVALDVAGGEIARARSCIVTAPIPQSLHLLRDVDLPKAVHARLDPVAYDRCVCLIFIVPPSVSLPLPVHGCAKWNDALVETIADNRSKGVCAGPSNAVTVHASAAWSEELYDRPDDDAAAALLHQALSQLGVAQPAAFDADLLPSANVKRWRYATPRTVIDVPSLHVPDLNLVFAGDAFAGPRVEGAFLSGLHAAATLSTPSSI